MAFTRLTREQYQALFDVFYGTATVNPADVADGALVTVAVTITGVALGDFVEFAPGIDIVDMIVGAQVTAANTVTVTIQNETGDHVDLASSTWNFVVRRPGTRLLNATSG